MAEISWGSCTCGDCGKVEFVAHCMSVKDGGDKQGGEGASGPSLRGDLAALIKLRLNIFVLLTTFFGFLIADLSQSGAWEWGLSLIHI